MTSVLTQLTVPIVGNYYASTAAQAAYNRLMKGDKLKLYFELTNKFDAFAIRVETSGGVEIGHLDRITAKKVCTLTEDWMSANPRHKIINRTDIKIQAKVVSTRDRVMLQITSLTLGKWYGKQ